MRRDCRTPVSGPHRAVAGASGAFMGKNIGGQLPVRMMLANDELRMVLVSIHVSLARGDRRGHS